MKSKDIGLLAVIAIVSGAVAIFVSGLIIPSNDKTQKVEVVAPISSEFNQLPKEYFNQDSINPTKEIETRVDPGSKPFSE